MNKFISLTFVLLLVGCAQQTQTQHVPDDNVMNVNQKAPSQLLASAMRTLKHGQIKKAVQQLFTVESRCNELFPVTAGEIRYTSRSPLETQYYQAQAEKNNKRAVIIDNACSNAFYLLGYSYGNLKATEQARSLLERAVAMAPKNAMYLSELAFTYQVQQDWDSALAIFKKAATAAKRFSPPEVQAQELGRAKRGMGFTLIELGKLAAAKRQFKECLAIDKNDLGAKEELLYIKQLTAKQG